MYWNKSKMMAQDCSRDWHNFNVPSFFFNWFKSRSVVRPLLERVVVRVRYLHFKFQKKHIHDTKWFGCIPLTKHIFTDSVENLKWNKLSKTVLVMWIVSTRTCDKCEDIPSTKYIYTDSAGKVFMRFSGCECWFDRLKNFSLFLLIFLEDLCLWV